MAGWHEVILYVDLTRSTAERRPIDRATLECFVGGVGLGAWLCLEAGGADVDDAFDVAAPLVFAASPLVGTAVATSAKLAVVGRSPLTGLLSDGLTSSDFAIELKRCGVDALVIRGAARAATEIVIDDGAVRFESAEHWSGSPASKCVRPGFETAAIGVAGEQKVRFASIANGSRHAGRGGLGAVMGSKRLKAISVRGTRVTPVAATRALTARARALAARSLGADTAKYRELGTLANLETFERLGVLPERNFLSTRSVARAPARPPATTGDERRSCAACNIGCEHRFVAREGQAAGSTVRLEYETAWALGPLLGVDDPQQVLSAAAHCDALGLDTISAGGTLAFAMEVGGFGVGFGDGERVPGLLEDIAHRRGAGGLLAEGARRAAQALGREEAAMHVKGLELPGYDPRALAAMALGLAVATRGADHNRSGAYELDFSAGFDRTQLADADVPAIVAIEDRNAALDSLVLCKFLRAAFDDPNAEWHELLFEVTGSRIDVAGLGARVAAVRKVFNQRAGWVPADDRLPARLHTARMSVKRLARRVRRYNLERGFEADGRVGPRVIRELGLSRWLAAFVDAPVAVRATRPASAAIPVGEVGP